MKRLPVKLRDQAWRTASEPGGLTPMHILWGAERITGTPRTSALAPRLACTRYRLVIPPNERRRCVPRPVYHVPPLTFEELMSIRGWRWSRCHTTLERGSDEYLHRMNHRGCQTKVRRVSLKRTTLWVPFSNGLSRPSGTGADVRSTQCRRSYIQYVHQNPVPDPHLSVVISLATS